MVVAVLLFAVLFLLAVCGALCCALCGAVLRCKEGPYQDRPPLCPFRLLPLLIYCGSTIAFLKILKVQGPKPKIQNM